MDVDKLLNELESVKQTGPDQWLARCPSHEDHTPSLSISHKGELVLIHCFAGCDPVSVLDSVGLQFADLYPEPLKPRFKTGRYQPPYRQILRAIAHEGLVVSLWLNSTDDAPLDPDDQEVVNRAITNIVRMGERWSK